MMEIKYLSPGYWLILILALASLTGCSSDDGGPIVAQSMTVATLALEEKSGYELQRSFTGRVEPARQSELGFELGGELAEVLVDEGSEVGKGQVLARLDRSRLLARKAEVVAALAQAEAQQALADATLQRMTEALAFKGIAQQEYDESAQAASVANASVARAKASLRSVSVDLEKSRLLAPYAAVVVKRYVDEGQILAPGQAVLALQEAGAPEVRIGIAGQVLQGVETGAVYTLNVNGRDVAATVKAVLPQRHAVTRTVDVVFRLQETEEEGTEKRLRPGDLATLALQQSLEEAGFWVPLGSLTEGRRGLWSNYVAEPLPAQNEQGAAAATHRLVSRAVDIVYENGEHAYVRGALLPGELIVADGIQRVVPGQEVRISENRHAQIENSARVN